MDYSIIWIILTLVGLIGFAFLIRYSTNKGYVKESDINFVIAMFDLTMAIVDELDLQKEKEIKNIATYVDLGLKFAKKISANDNMYDVIVDYTIDLCETNNIEVTDQRKLIIQQLTQIALNDVE